MIYVYLPQNTTQWPLILSTQIEPPVSTGSIWRSNDPPKSLNPEIIKLPSDRPWQESIYRPMENQK